MNKRLSAILMACLVSAMPIASAAPASAQGYWGGPGFGGRHFNERDFASGILGFTFGTIIGSALAAPRYGYGYPYDYGSGYGRGYYGRPYYDLDPGYRRGYYAPPYYRAPRYYAQNSGSHVQRCLDRYRSYDPASDTFVGYDGRLHYCRL